MLNSLVQIGLAIIGVILIVTYLIPILPAPFAAIVTVVLVVGVIVGLFRWAKWIP